jgi:metallophosphoesterase (TIGR00282 family)
MREGGRELRLLFVGDVVGRPGRRALAERLPALRSELRPDFVLVNGENAAGGFGLTRETFDEIIAAGADVVTLGNHTWDKKEILGFIDAEPRLVRPANYPPGVPGNGAALVEGRTGARVLVIQVLGRVFNHVALECPFRTVDALLEERWAEEADAVVVDVHGDATSEKIALAHYLDGRVDVVVGTHTHVQTNDARVLPKGTATVTDLGMTGPHDSVLGVRKEIVIERFLTQMPNRFETASGDVRLQGLFVRKLGRRVEEVRLIDR